MTDWLFWLIGETMTVLILLLALRAFGYRVWFSVGMRKEFPEPDPHADAADQENAAP